MSIDDEFEKIVQDLEPPPLTTKELDQAKCEIPECTHDHDEEYPIYFHSQCHPQGGPPWLRYEKGIITLECPICNQTVGKIKVADE